MEVPEPLTVSEQIETPQELAPSLPKAAPSHPSNEEFFQAASKACTELTASVTRKVNDLEKVILNLLVTNEDTFELLGEMKALIDRAIQEPADFFQGIATLQNYVNRIHELN